MNRASSSALLESVLQPALKRNAYCSQFLLKFGSAVAVGTGPWLSAVLVAAFAAVVGILHASEIEILLPVRTFLLKWSRAIADLDPARRLIFTAARVAHIAQVFSLRDRSLAEGFIVYGPSQVRFAAWFDTCSDQISHRDWMPEMVARMGARSGSSRPMSFNDA